MSDGIDYGPKKIIDGLSWMNITSEDENGNAVGAMHFYKNGKSIHWAKNFRGKTNAEILEYMHSGLKRFLAESESFTEYFKEEKK